MTTSIWTIAVSSSRRAPRARAHWHWVNSPSTTGYSSRPPLCDVKLKELAKITAFARSCKHLLLQFDPEPAMSAGWWRWQRRHARVGCWSQECRWSHVVTRRWRCSRGSLLCVSVWSFQSIVAVAKLSKMSAGLTNLDTQICIIMRMNVTFRCQGNRCAELQRLLGGHKIVNIDLINPKALPRSQSYYTTRATGSFHQAVVSYSVVRSCKINHVITNCWQSLVFQ